MADLTPFPFGEDFQDIIIESAVLYADGEPLSVSRGGIAFEPGEEWDDYPFPGKTMSERGCREVVRLSPVLRGNLMMTGERQLDAYRPGGTWADHATISGARTFTIGTLRTPLASDVYLQSVLCVWKRQRGDYLAVEFPVAICRRWSISSIDGDEGMIPVEIEAVRDRVAGTPPIRVHTLPGPTTTDDIPDGGDTGELPDGEDLGNIIFDHDALHAFYAAYTDGQTVGTPHDASSRGNDGTGGGGANVTYKHDAFGSGLHAVRIGADTAGYYVGLPAQNIQTWYFVVGNVTGAGTEGNGGATTNAMLAFTDGGAANRFNVSVRADGKLAVAWNNSGTFANQKVGTHTISGAGPHLVRVVWDQVNARVLFYVDGALDGTINLDFNGNLISVTLVYLGNYNGAPEIAKVRVDYGQVLCYDRAHVGAIAAPVETSLQAKWGTP